MLFFDPLVRKRREKHRREVLSRIRGEQLDFEHMVQRARIMGDTPDESFVCDVLSRIREIEHRATTETNKDELDNLASDAEQQGQLRAYICPMVEIQVEGMLAIDRMEEWAVPKAVIIKLRASIDDRLANTDDHRIAGSALRSVFREYDSWSGYTDDYENQLHFFTRWLFLASIVLFIMSTVLFQFRHTFPVGLLLAGASGSCVSVMAKMPIFDVALSGELVAYERRILSRVAVGMIASLIGCGLLGWGVIPISLQGKTFTDVLKSCTDGQVVPCGSLETLIALGVAMLFGWSERALTSLEEHVFGKSRDQ